MAKTIRPGTADNPESGVTQKKQPSLLASGTSLSVLTLGSRILGLVREMIKASLLGTSALADAFNVAFMIPNLFRRLFAENSISVAFIPTFRGYLEDREKEETREFLSATMTLIAFLTTLIVAAGIAASPLIVPLFTGENTQALPSETVLLTRIMFPYLAIISLAAFFQGILNGVRIFLPSGFTPILFNICVIACTYLLAPFTENPARAMAAGVIIGGIIQAGFQMPFVLKQGWKFSFTSINRAFSNPGTRRVLTLVGPTIIGMAAYQLNDIVSTALAGRAGSGIVSSLQYSLRLQELILGIFAVSIGTVILPDLSSFAKRERWGEFNAMLSRAMDIIALITIPVTFFALATGENIIILVFRNNRFTDESVRLTLEAFICHIGGLYFIALNRIVSPAFYAQGNTKSPTIAGIIGFGINIILALLLVTPMRGAGIALALSLASLGNTIALFVFLRRN
ncbi:MAG: murein biosynthesis integral membrane protein MurJ, partial [Spirochaetaceae bacterium]|nr:murein biosynthesis integral membrane protein MurJ [Spirochaetaceae bacterium]